MDLPERGSGGRPLRWYWKPGFQPACKVVSDIVAARHAGDEMTAEEHVALVSEGYCPACRYHGRVSRLTRAGKMRMLPETHPGSVVRTFAGCERKFCDWHYQLTSDLGHLPPMLPTGDVR